MCVYKLVMLEFCECNYMCILYVGVSKYDQVLLQVSVNALI